jgi:hypothetical protein
MITARYLICVGLASLLLISGCGPVMYPVHGQLVWDDGSPAKELAGGFVGFNSDAADLSARGEIQPDGSFTLSSLRKNDGLPPGRYQILIAPPEPGSTTSESDEATELGKLLPEKYQSYETSGLEATLEARENRLTLTIQKAQLAPRDEPAEPRAESIQ